MRTLEKPSADLLADGLVPKGCQQQKKAKNSKTTTNNIKHEEFSAIKLIFKTNINNNNLSNLLHMDQTWSPVESSLTDVNVGNVPPKNDGGNICRKSSGSAVTWFSLSLRCLNTTNIDIVTHYQPHKRRFSWARTSRSINSQISSTLAGWTSIIRPNNSLDLNWFSELLAATEMLWRSGVRWDFSKTCGVSVMQVGKRKQLCTRGLERQWVRNCRIRHFELKAGW